MLNCHTYYSLKYGTLSPDDLFQECKEKGVHKIILTDINSTGGWIEMARICEQRKGEYQLDLAVGIEFRHEQQLLYMGLARNGEGFEELNRFLSYHNTSKKRLPPVAPAFKEAYIIYPWPKPIEGLREREFVGIRIHQINKLFTSSDKAHQEKLVAWHPVTFKGKRGFQVHRLLRAIGKNTLLSKLLPEDICNENEEMLAPRQLFQHFQQYPEIIKNTLQVLDDCQFEVELYKSKNKKHYNKTLEEDRAHLRTLAYEGLYRRYGQPSEYAVARLERELEVIAKLKFEAYFLITWDFIQFATSRGFAHVGRGSGANSLVAYCMDITEVDPIELDLYFERFLNPHRTSPPDFDIDFSWQDRDEVTKYIFEKYGYDHVALLSCYSTFQGRATLRELGKVFGLPKNEIDALVAHPERYQDKDHISRLIIKYGAYLMDFPKELSIHAGGIIISEEPIYRITATSFPPKGFPVTYFDMMPAEDIGYYKYDVLSQRGLGHIKDTMALVEKNRAQSINIKQFKKFKDDARIRNLLQEGRTMGCFYVESPAMRMLLGKLQCKTYETLVAASSIIRPGVASSGMMREYIYRHHHPSAFEYIHPKMEELMKETYGVMVYQEDVIKVAHHFAGLELGESDILRRGMSGKLRSRGEIKKVEKKFFENCRRMGYTEEITKEVWRQIESFSGYSFSKAHSASFAVESYESLYLKAYFPLEFMVGVINNFGGFYRTEFYFHEARMAGADIQAPCVNKGDYLTSIQGKTIYVGFIHLKYLEKSLGLEIEKQRKSGGPFECLEDFTNRVPVGLEQAIILIRIGAFRFTGKTKGELLWEVQAYFGKSKKQSPPGELFKVKALEFKLPVLEKPPFEDAFDALELLEFPLCHPFGLLETPDKGNVVARGLLARTGKRVDIVGYVVTSKDTWTKGGLRMAFGTFLDEAGEFFDTIHFPDVAKRCPFMGKGFYRIIGVVQEDFGFPAIEVELMEKLPMVKMGVQVGI
ncbi:MAG: DNA polymerase III subunit alpha [Bacteroidota bacterium]|nr:DNA polymerase III subunit alpha [Bacteroidota bacterium]